MRVVVLLKLMLVSDKIHKKDHNDDDAIAVLGTMKTAVVHVMIPLVT